MGVPKRLTEMQMRFSEFVVFGGVDGPMTQAEAAIAAGYSANRARQEGSELLNPRLSPLVVQYVGKLKEERLRKFEVSYEGHVAELSRIKELALKKGSFSSAVNAETNRGKAAGLYIDRKIIKHGKLEDLSEQELEAKMKQILEDYSPILNVTPEDEVLEQKTSQTKTETKETKLKNIVDHPTSTKTSKHKEKQSVKITL
jgi:glutamate mutase epsilon subunit|tara:strand:- start:324 stop:923 length:600 start_codon:yes stop_codon:yes gene_type:complete